GVLLRQLQVLDEPGADLRILLDHFCVVVGDEGSGETARSDTRHGASFKALSCGALGIDPSRRGSDPQPLLGGSRRTACGSVRFRIGPARMYPRASGHVVPSGW